MAKGKSVGDFKQYREVLKKRTFARAERFEVQFALVNLLQKSNGIAKKLNASAASLETDVALFCEEVQIPGMILSNKEFNIGPWTFFRNTKVGFLGNEINFTFLTDNDWNLRGLFEHWIDACASVQSQQLGYLDDISTEITISALDMQDNVKKEWKLYECMPKVLNLVPLSSGTTSAIRTTLIISAAYWEASENYGPYPNKPNDRENDGTLEPSSVDHFGANNQEEDFQYGYAVAPKKPLYKPPPWKPGAKKLESFDSGNQEE